MIKEIYDLTDAQIYDLQERHNKLVRLRFWSEWTDGFCSWVDSKANFSEGYIEIPSYQTLSGHAEILELETGEVK